MKSCDLKGTKWLCLDEHSNHLILEEGNWMLLRLGAMNMHDSWSCLNS